MTESSRRYRQGQMSGWILNGADRVGRGGLGFVPIIVFLLVALLLSRWIPFPLLIALAAVVLFLTRPKNTTTGEAESEPGARPTHETEGQ